MTYYVSVGTLWDVKLRSFTQCTCIVLVNCMISEALDSPYFIIVYKPTVQCAPTVQSASV